MVLIITLINYQSGRDSIPLGVSFASLFMRYEVIVLVHYVQYAFHGKPSVSSDASISKSPLRPHKRGNIFQCIKEVINLFPMLDMCIALT